MTREEGDKLPLAYDLTTTSSLILALDINHQINSPNNGGKTRTVPLIDSSAG